ncbi:DUF3551 domain-containing protein [Rhodoplanes sp.]|uniref:DUF3551 domain-containing protein n=1 Tax=Rhodoplanes sp. TaxID=1968906 RepID=UPI0025FB7250|nr:DUF3551 domain-containing protein [Rhodoplanes sp.]
MRALLLGAAVAVTMVSGIGRADADPFGIWSPPSWSTWYPWCANLNIGFEQTSCAYSTLQQCLATVRGVGGSCGPNPYPPPPGPPPRVKRKRAR